MPRSLLRIQLCCFVSLGKQTSSLKTGFMLASGKRHLKTFCSFLIAASNRLSKISLCLGCSFLFFFFYVISHIVRKCFLVESLRWQDSTCDPDFFLLMGSNWCCLQWASFLFFLPLLLLLQEVEELISLWLNQYVCTFMFLWPFYIYKQTVACGLCTLVCIPCWLKVICMFYGK